MFRNFDFIRAIFAIVIIVVVFAIVVSFVENVIPFPHDNDTMSTQVSATVQAILTATVK